MIRDKIRIRLRILYFFFFFFIIVKRLIKICKYSFWKLEDGIIKRNEGEFCKILTSYAKSHDCQKKESFGKNIFFTAVILELFKIGYLRKQEILAILLPDFQDLTIWYFFFWTRWNFKYFNFWHKISIMKLRLILLYTYVKLTK